MTFAADLLRAEGDVVVIPLALAKKIGLPAAAFLRQAAYLSAVVEGRQGWFFLDQEGEGNPLGKTIFQRLGSWHSCLGIGPDAQLAIRKKLGKNGLGLLQETRKGMVHGRILYKVDSEKYLEFLASCASLTHCSDEQTGIPECANQEYNGCADRKFGLHNRKKPADKYKVYKKVDIAGIPPLPTSIGEGCGVNTITPIPTAAPLSETVNEFLRAAGNPDVLLAEIENLEVAIADASDDQAMLAGFAWKSTAVKTNPVRLAVKLCEKAAAGLITPCALAIEESQKALKVAAEHGYAKLRALHGKKFRTKSGKTARVDGEWIYFDPCNSYPKGSSLSGHEALECLRQIEDGCWQPI